MEVCILLRSIRVYIARRLPADPSMTVGWLNIQFLSNKNDAVERLIVERSIDAMALTETWHSASDDARLRLAVLRCRRRCSSDQSWRRSCHRLQEDPEMCADITADM